MNLNHLETQRERTKRQRQHSKKQRKIGVMSRPLKFVFCFLGFA